ncbi:MAG: patatin-like phospholipase family protein [Caulobacteraceae bacterium]
MTESLAAALRGLGFRAAVVGGEATDRSAAELQRLAEAHDFLLIEVGRDDLSGAPERPTDRLILVGRASEPFPEGSWPRAAPGIGSDRPDLVLVHAADGGFPTGSAGWLTAAPTARLIHVRDGARSDIARVARLLSGRSVGLALGGGGARAYAHIGVLKALRELGQPIDCLAGSSMGAVIAAGVAMDWDLPELEARVRMAFVASSPLADIALPLLAMSHGARVGARLSRHFGETDIRDLWRAFACVSTDLTTGAAREHRTGPLHRALRASISIPGVLPPVVEGGHVLVDGSLIDNLPVDLVQEMHGGKTIGVDVAEFAGLAPEDLQLHPPGLRWLLSGAWRRGPPIVSVLIRAATMPSAKAMIATRDRAEVVIVPELAGIEIQDWKAYAPAVEAGYRAAMAKADALTTLV